MSKPKRESDIKVPHDFLKDLLTPSELRMLKNRWQIINLSKEGLVIRKIASQVKVGTDTVVRTIRMAEKNNLLNKLGNEADKKIKSSTPWIFGKSR